MITAIAFKFLCALIGFFMVFIFGFIILRLHDKMLGVPFKESFKKVQDDGRGLAIYYGFRYLATYISMTILVIVCFVL